MKMILVAFVAAAAIALGAAAVLNGVQQTVDHAFATSGARI